MLQKIILIGLVAIAFLLTSCDSKGGSISTEVELPLDNMLTLYCENAGVHPETCVLDDPDNPYANANINMDNVWDLEEECPSAKSKYYLWATILAKIPIGEYQYFTATSLHELYTVGGSENAKEQAKKAYRVVLDQFFNSVTWWNAWWIDEDTYYAVILKDMVGENLYDPSEMNLLPLYSDPALALADLSEWGYVYDQDTKTISKRD